MTRIITVSLLRRIAAIVAATAWLGPGHAADLPPLRGVDVFGSDRLDADALRAEFGADLDRYVELTRALKSGDPREVVKVRAALAAIETQIAGDLEQRTPLASVALSLVTYELPDPAVYITVDVVEQGETAKRMPFRPTPTGSFADPGGLLAAWERYSDAVFGLVRSGVKFDPAPGDCPVLHCLAPFDRPELAPYLMLFDDGVPKHADELARIAIDDADAQQRAAAVFLLAHTNDPARVLPLLGRAIHDPSETVRSNALRMLLVIATEHPDFEFPIADLITALDFAQTADRSKAAYCVAALATTPKYREAIRKDAVPVALELLRLEQPNNHDPAYLILVGVSGESFGERDYAEWARWAATHR